ncbi:Uncharacterised protein [BD1-7 clade bacterium]|uniref:DUF4136 domain-containing protein n=1 Tax=BD1-7 clade bacterium TaxID=2029982 RepID=A0A5S9R111_9GAMM|nr:Uncharacterised protein [BD1-7 clade bacterium]
MRLLKLNFLVVFLVLALAGCSSTTLRDVWQSDEFRKGELQKMLVVGLSENVTHRLVFERDVSDSLKPLGVDAIASFTVLGKGEPNKEEVHEYVKTHNIPYVLVTYVDKVERNETYVPPDVSVVGGPYPYGRYPHGYYPSFNSMWGPGGTAIVSSPGYTKKTTNTILVTSIYDTDSGEIVWTANTATFQTKSVSKISQEVADVVWNNIHE